MRINVRDVLRRADLQLRLVAETDPTALDAVVTWVVSSDLADPAPFLDRGNLLLTTGRQFDPRSAAGGAGDEQRYTDDANAYIAGLRRRGVCAVGFGLRVLHTGTPPTLVEACRKYGMPLFEVPYHIPFIAVIRAAADLIDAAGHRRSAWALNATRAISSAVLRASPIDSVLGELGRQLGRGVILVDARARARSVHGMLTDDPLVVAARVEAARLLNRGRRTGATVTVPHAPPPPVGKTDPLPAPLTEAGQRSVLTMQTIGPDAELRGVLVVAGPSTIDSTEQTVVASVVALLWFSLGEWTGRTSLRTTTQRALWHILMDGDADFVRIGAPSVGMRLPDEPVRAVAWSPGPPAPAMRGLRLACDDGRQVVFSNVDGTVLACVGADGVEALAQVAPERGVGVSEPVLYSELPGAVERALRAARRAAKGETIALDDPDVGGLTALFTTPDMLDLARGLLRPLEEQDARSRSGLVDALAAWLRENGNFEAAARRLGLHRHTLTTRVSRAATLIGRNLDDVDTRMDLWLALRLTGRV